MNLLPHQKSALAALENTALEELRSIGISMPTGFGIGGLTCGVINHLVQQADASRILVIAEPPRIPFWQEQAKLFSSARIDVVSFASAARTKETAPAPDILVIDEHWPVRADTVRAMAATFAASFRIEVATASDFVLDHDLTLGTSLRRASEDEAGLPAP